MAASAISATDNLPEIELSGLYATTHPKESWGDVLVQFRPSSPVLSYMGVDYAAYEVSLWKKRGDTVRKLRDGLFGTYTLAAVVPDRQGRALLWYSPDERAFKYNKIVSVGSDRSIVIGSQGRTNQGGSRTLRIEIIRKKALAFLRSSRPPDGTPLLVKMLLMAGRLREAFDTARDEPALGWSYGQSAGGVLFAGIVSFLCLERIQAAPTVRRLLCRNVDGDRHEEESGAAAGVSVSREILEGLQGTTASQEELSQYRAWATSIGRKRIEQIVSNRHRGAYGRAAEVLGSLAELCALVGEAQQGRELIDEYRNRRFNRYVSFRRELDSVIASSATLKRILGAKER